jgi:hypothetical protein
MSGMLPSLLCADASTPLSGSAVTVSRFQFHEAQWRSSKLILRQDNAPQREGRDAIESKFNDFNFSYSNADYIIRVPYIILILVRDRQLNFSETNLKDFATAESDALRL